MLWSPLWQPVRPCRWQSSREQGGTCEVALPVPDAGFEKGKAYDVVLKFTTTAVEPVATIGAWVDASDRVEITL